MTNYYTRNFICTHSQIWTNTLLTAQNEIMRLSRFEWNHSSFKKVWYTADLIRVSTCSFSRFAPIILILDDPAENHMQRWTLHTNASNDALFVCFSNQIIFTSWYFCYWQSPQITLTFQLKHAPYIFNYLI